MAITKWYNNVYNEDPDYLETIGKALSQSTAVATHSSKLKQYTRHLPVYMQYIKRMTVSAIHYKIHMQYLRHL